MRNCTKRWHSNKTRQAHSYSLLTVDRNIARFLVAVQNRNQPAWHVFVKAHCCLLQAFQQSHDLCINYGFTILQIQIMQTSQYLSSHLHNMDGVHLNSTKLRASKGQKKIVFHWELPPTNHEGQVRNCCQTEPLSLFHFKRDQPKYLEVILVSDKMVRWLAEVLSWNCRKSNTDESQFSQLLT